MCCLSCGKARENQESRCSNCGANYEVDKQGEERITWSDTIDGSLDQSSGSFNMGESPEEPEQKRVNLSKERNYQSQEEGPFVVGQGNREPEYDLGRDADFGRSTTGDSDSRVGLDSPGSGPDWTTKAPDSWLPGSQHQKNEEDLGLITLMPLVGMISGIISLIFCFCGFLGVLAVILSIISVKLINEGRLPQSNFTFALIGMITGFIGFTLQVIFIILGN